MADILVSELYISQNYTLRPSGIGSSNNQKLANYGWITTNFYCSVSGVADNDRLAGLSQLSAIQPPTTTTTTTLPTLSFDLNYSCDGVGADITANNFAGVSNYEISSVPYSSLANAYSGSFVSVTTSKVYNNITNGTWYVVLRDANNTTNSTYRSVTFNCTTTTTTTLGPTTTTTTTIVHYYILQKCSDNSNWQNGPNSGTPTLSSGQRVEGATNVYYVITAVSSSSYSYSNIASISATGQFGCP